MFRSNAKLLITGEYLVLEGASALALPLKFGQSLELVNDQEPEVLRWETWYEERLLFSARFDPVNFSVINSSSEVKSDYISKVLVEASRLCHTLPDNIPGKAVSRLDFNINWGLGSSSSLISNIAWWFDVDPFELFFRVSNGSGYDIACARSSHPLLYSIREGKPHYRDVQFIPPFRDKLFFIYLGHKQDSYESVRIFRDKRGAEAGSIDEISRISLEMTQTDNLKDFERLMKRHESIISGILRQSPAGRKLFPDYPGEIKSLGAWGGDFIMATAHQPDDQVIDYFYSKGLETVFSFEDLSISCQ